MASYKKVVEMLGENLASFLELGKKWLVDWNVDVKKLLHFLHQFHKEDLIGLMNGTHEVKAKMAESSKRNTEFIPTLFQKSNIVNAPGHPESFLVNKENVMNFIQPILAREAEMGNVDPWIDNDLWNYFDGKIVPGFGKDFKTAVYRFLSKMSHRQILAEAEKTGIKQIYTWLEAFSIIKQTVLSGEVDKKGTGVIVYFNFKVDNDDILYRFRAFRGDDGQLDLSVLKVALVSEYDPGVGACFSN